MHIKSHKPKSFRDHVLDIICKLIFEQRQLGILNANRRKKQSQASITKEYLDLRKILRVLGCFSL